MTQNGNCLKIALIQTELFWEDPISNRAMFTAKIEQIREVVDVIVLPEMFTSGFTMSPDNIKEEESLLTLTWMKKMASMYNAAIVGSTVFKEDNYKGFKICPLICYDLRFPVWSRNTENFDVLLYAANWPTPRINAWDALLKARAIENMVYCIGVNRIGTDKIGHNYPGHTSCYNPQGILMEISRKEEILIVEICKNEIDSLRTKLPFLEDRDQFNLID